MFRFPMGRVVAAAFAVMSFLAPVGGGAVAETLRFLTWDEYTSPTMIAAFRRETGIEIVVEPILSDAELLERVRSHPERYDVINPGDYLVPALIRDGLLDRFEPVNLPGFSNLAEAWRARSYDSGNQYSIPFHWGTTSFVVDGDRFRGDIDTYDVLFSPPPELRGPTGILKGASTLIKASLIHLGLPTCSVEPDHLARIRSLLVDRFKGATVLTATDVVDRIAKGDLRMAIAWNGDALKARGIRPALRYAYPREGVMVFSDALAISKAAPNRAGALKFIDFMMRPENAAMQTNFTRYANAIRGSDAFIDPDLLDAPEVIVPTSVDISFQQYCADDVQLVHDALLEEVLGALGSPVGR